MKYYKTITGLKYIKIYEVRAFNEETQEWETCQNFTSAKGAKNWITFAEKTYKCYKNYYTKITLVWCNYFNK